MNILKLKKKLLAPIYGAYIVSPKGLSIDTKECTGRSSKVAQDKKGNISCKRYSKHQIQDC